MRRLIGEFLIILAKVACYIPDRHVRNQIANRLESWFKALNL